MKEGLLKILVLFIPDPSNQFPLKFDDLYWDVRTLIFQISEEGAKHTVSYFVQNHIQSKKNYPVCNKEPL